ncbi:hypothetical protein NMY22_g11999 [Coprinellus aureogranulatus]|nr:hypothetical protein NMY22_g11999 [Coprinellus aureogranulatus]
MEVLGFKHHRRLVEPHLKLEDENLHGIRNQKGWIALYPTPSLSPSALTSIVDDDENTLTYAHERQLGNGPLENSHECPRPPSRHVDHSSTPLRRLARPINPKSPSANEAHHLSVIEGKHGSSSIMLPTLALAFALFVPLIRPVSAQEQSRRNSTYYNPILPGFHPDPSCIFLQEWDDTFFCASSSFNAFPGIPIHASKDLQNWKLIGHVLNRKEQLPRLAETNRSTSGIWAPTLRYHKKNFYLVTTLVDDDKPQSDSSRWDNIIFKGSDPYNPSSWGIAKHIKFEGYDTEPFWDSDGKAYITGAHAWQVKPGIWQAEADLDTGKVGEFKQIWEGTGGLAPEGPHIYKKDGHYYLLAAEGGTGLEHMVTISRSKNINGPFESNPANPILTSTNTSSYFQTIGHADLFQDGSGNWWAVALSTRGGPEYKHFPMVRETVLAPVSWRKGEWPVATQVSGKMSDPSSTTATTSPSPQTPIGSPNILPTGASPTPHTSLSPHQNAPTPSA